MPILTRSCQDWHPAPQSPADADTRHTDPDRVSEALPAGTLVAEVEHVWVQNLRKDLQRLDQPRTGAVEVLISVGQEHAPALYGPQPRPTRLPGQERQVLLGLGKTVTTQIGRAHV